MQVSMELVDARGRRWRVLDVRRIGRAGSLFSLIPGFGPPQSRIVQELESLPDLTLAEVRERTKDSIETFKINYMGFDGDEIEFDLMMEKIRQTDSIAGLYELLQPDTFEPY